MIVSPSWSCLLMSDSITFLWFTTFLSITCTSKSILSISRVCLFLKRCVLLLLMMRVSFSCSKLNHIHLHKWFTLSLSLSFLKTKSACQTWLDIILSSSKERQLSWWLWWWWQKEYFAIWDLGLIDKDITFLQIDLLHLAVDVMNDPTEINANVNTRCAHCGSSFLSRIHKWFSLVFIHRRRPWRGQSPKMH